MFLSCLNHWTFGLDIYGKVVGLNIILGVSVSVLDPIKVIKPIDVQKPTLGSKSSFRILLCSVFQPHPVYGGNFV